MLASDGNERLDLRVEEYDSILVTFALREWAAIHRVPVVMETSDRGLIDIERFDQNPAAPFHGRFGSLSSPDLQGPRDEQKLELVLRIVGTEHMSGRAAASILEIGETLVTWPQLASDVALGGALGAHRARRIPLGQPLSSGRYYVDLDARLAPDSRAAAPVDDCGVACAEAQAAPSPPPLRRTDEMNNALIKKLVHYATLAPSAHNAQPWLFRWDGKALHVSLDRRRVMAFLDIPFVPRPG